MRNESKKQIIDELKEVRQRNLLSMQEQKLPIYVPQVETNI